MKPSYTTLPDSYIQYLEDKRRKFQQAVESSPASVIITDREGKIEYVNPKFTQITGYSLAEIKGENPRILKSGLTPQSVFKEMWKTITAGKEWSGEFINRKKTGEIYYEYAQISPIMNDRDEITHYVGIKEDISFRKLTETEREEYNLFTQNIINVIPLPIMVIDMDYRVILTNSAAEKISNIDSQEAFPFCYSLSHCRETPCSGEEHPCPLKEIKKNHSPTILIHKHYGPNGEARYIEINAAPLFSKDGKLRGIIETSRDITERQKAEEKLKYIAHYDQLTQIPNRLLFYDRLERSLALAKREETGLAILFIDLDGFKSINDTYGHDIGDLMLQAVAQRLKNSLRNSDTVGRMGGDEFMAILYGISVPSKAEKVAGKILSQLEAPFYFDALTCHIGASIGISIFPDDGEEEEILVKKADQAMYNAKSDQVNSIVSYSSLK